MARSNVPKFGTWENADNDVPYTVYFDKARKNRVAGGKMINPNDPKENPEMFGNMYPPKSNTKPDEPIGRGAVRPTPEQRVGSEFSGSRGRNENMGQKTSNEPNYGGRGQRPAPSELSFERSPLHPHYQAKAMGRGEVGRNGDSGHGTTNRPRLRPVRGEESPEKGAAVPRFGEWNENDPQSAENFTRIFNEVREERNIAGTGNVIGTPKHPPYIRNQPSNEPKKCCFPWW